MLQNTPNTETNTEPSGDEMDQLADAAAIAILVFFIGPGISGAILGALIWRSKRILGACLGIMIGVALGFALFAFIGNVLTPAKSTQSPPPKPVTKTTDQ